MPREPKTGTCTVCKQEKPLFDVKNQICGSCMGKKGGRPPIITPKKPPEKPPVQPPEKPPADPTPPASGEDVQYQCDSCGNVVRYGQHKCRCGTWIDWRGSPVQDDPDLVVCPECGAICGHVDSGVAKCPHCNFMG